MTFSMRSGIVTVMLCAAAVAGCQGKGTTTPQSGATQQRLAPREVLTVSSVLAVTFDSVTSESRCPTGVQCVWAGDATVHVTASGGALPLGPTHVTLHITSTPREVVVGGYTVRLDSLTPYPTANGGIDPSAYRATLSVRPTPE